MNSSEPAIAAPAVAELAASGSVIAASIEPARLEVPEHANGQLRVQLLSTLPVRAAGRPGDGAGSGIGAMVEVRLTAARRLQPGREATFPAGFPSCSIPNPATAPDRTSVSPAGPTSRPFLDRLHTPNAPSNAPTESERSDEPA